MMEDTVEFRGRVSQTDYNEFSRLFPSYGARSWFIREALRAFLDKVRSDPMTPITIQVSIAEMIGKHTRPDE